VGFANGHWVSRYHLHKQHFYLIKAFLYLSVLNIIMASIIIQSENSDNVKLIAKLAKKLGINVSDVTDEQSEDLALGSIMTKVKTGENVSRESIMKKLHN
jgi:urease accessory protein UreF